MKNLIFGLLSLSLFVPGTNPSAFAANFEAVPAGETQMIQDILHTLKTQVRTEFMENGMALRDAHAKQHGCVRADVSVLPRLSSSSQSSVFIPSQSYKVWIRYSNGSGKSQDDSEGDGRGMAIKIIGAGDAGVQDILMINHPVFFVRNVKDYVDFTNAVAGGSPFKFFFNGLNPLNWRLHEAGIGKAIQGKKVTNPLGVQYWSMTPYLYGKSAAKFSARPCNTSEITDHSTIGASFLRHNMAATLTKQDACFILGAQFFVNQKITPIEDPTIEWKESQTPMIDLARITIPQQKFTSEAQMDFCENISLSPWHYSADHRPLGGINRARRAIYDGISSLRHELNGKNIPEVTGEEKF